MVKPSPKVIAAGAMGKKAAKTPGNPKASPVTSVRMSSASGKDCERTLDVRKIDNGFIVRESVYHPKKGYSSTERYSATAPEIKVDGAGMKAKK